MVLALTATQAPHFTLASTGAVQLHVDGGEARFGPIPTLVHGRPMVTISLGASHAEGSLMLSVPGAESPAAGRYQIIASGAARGSGNTMTAAFVAGSPEHPVGWFEGQSGWVTITASDAGRVSGTFEISAAGVLTSKPDDERQRVTVRGMFVAQRDSGVATIASAQ